MNSIKILLDNDPSFVFKESSKFPQICMNFNYHLNFQPKLYYIVTEYYESNPICVQFMCQWCEHFHPCIVRACFCCRIGKTCWFGKKTMVWEYDICTRCDGWKKSLHSLNLGADCLDYLIGSHGTIFHCCWLAKGYDWFTSFVCY
jgi:hypothetical protein